ncbi:putative N-glycosylase/DNA lyase [Sulfuracidifex tepidarius]|uniref:N-glycosylase/DNA lyase n=1 Tax=Sulfuracidifex tepidarius TaxID=1294262 RepID=A0A510DUG2_9CREN|nr:putative N-glycosylase/DNA lyase [Sulfuracidifex tepidarius]BBG26559.1 putative N-glycosylase/DNA lyase [Sulfuracidifex tepidarius]
MNNKAGNDVWARELLLCQLTANSSFVSAYLSLMCSWDSLWKGEENEVALSLKRCGYRFPNLKARFITKNRHLLPHIRDMVKPIADEDQGKAREYIVKNFIGFGYKEASHFLRNVGYFDLAIIDRHILSFLKTQGLSFNFKTMTKYRYLQMESVLRSISNALGIDLGILDLFIWFEETETVLK